MKIKDRLLFLKYALPCASTLVRRGIVSQDYVDSLIALVSENKVPREDAESLFRVANVMCASIAKRSGKNLIDAGVIREYFLLEHSDVVDDRFELMKDFNPVDCKTYAGKVIEVSGGSALVETASGKKRYKTIFVKDIKKKEIVAVHFDFIVEKIPELLAEKMNKVVHEKRD